MLFNSLEFLLFLPATFLLYWFAFKPLRLQNIFIVAASYLFYGWWDMRFLLLIAVTTLCSYASGLLLERTEGKRRLQKGISAANIVLNLSILSFFKYFNFFGENFAALLRPVRHPIRLDNYRYIITCGHQFLHVSGIELYD